MPRSRVEVRFAERDGAFDYVSGRLSASARTG
jgi:hypothetical protein